MKDAASILIIDDEIQIRRLLDITLSSEGFQVMEAESAKEALVKAATHSFDVIILDLGLPDMDGQELLIKLREWYARPIIVLSVRNSEEDIIKALDQGANDYLTKPFRSGELLARIRAAMRSISGKETEETVLSFGDIEINLPNHTVCKQSELIKLTATEYTLLVLMVKNRGRVLTHQYILKEVWGYGYVEQTQYLRVFIAQLRKKIEANPAKPKFIITESGIGYRFGE
jgi:two-component system KDP operon response regulator KdpE